MRGRGANTATLPYGLKTSVVKEFAVVVGVSIIGGNTSKKRRVCCRGIRG